MLPKSKIGLALWMGLRYVRSRNRTVSRSINWVSFGGIVLGISLLLVVVAVQNGLSRNAEQGILKVVPHVVLPYESVSASEIDALRQSNNVVRVERFAELYALLMVEGYEVSVVVHAVDSSEEFETLATPHSTFDQQDNAALNPYSVPVGSLASGDSFALTFPVVAQDLLHAERTWFRWTADTSGNSGVSFPLVVVYIEDLIRQGVLETEQADWRVTLRNPWEADVMFSDSPSALTWTQAHAELFSAIGLEKTIIFVLLTFVIALASLNIVSGQAMLINSKKTDIAILRTLGADRLLLNLAFAMHGLIIVVAGIVVGVCLGTLICGIFEGLLDLMLRVFASSQDFGSLHGIDPFLLPKDIALTVAVSFTIACLGVLRPLALVLKANPIDALHSPG